MKRIAQIVGMVALGASVALGQTAKQAPILLTTDVACTVSVDGDTAAVLSAGETKKIPVSPGEHVVVAVAIDGRRLSKTVQARDTQVVADFEFGGALAAGASAPAVAAHAPAASAGQPATAPAAPVTPALRPAEPAPQRVPAGARLYVAPMDGFETYLSAALRKKEVPVSVTSNKDQADFIVNGTASSGKKPGLFTTLLVGKTGTDEDASISVTHIASGAIVYSYSVQKGDSYHGKQSSAESCAKHLKGHIEGKE